MPMTEDVYSKTHITCPRCAEMKAIDTEAEYSYEEGEHTEFCDECDNEFTVSTMVTYTYISRGTK